MDIPKAELLLKEQSTAIPLVLEQEQLVGIQQFIHPELIGISGVFKQRFSDFIVREITPDHEVTYLKSIDGKDLEKSIFSISPKEEEEAEEHPQQSEKVDEPVITNGKQLAEMILQEIEKILPGISEIEKRSFLSFVEGHYHKDANAPKDFLGFSSNDKVIRSQLHQIIRKYAGNLLETTAKPIDGNQQSKNNSFNLLILPKSTSNPHHSSSQLKDNFAGRGGRQQNKRKFDEWPKDCPDYLHFTVMKENIDTMNAGYILAKHLKMKVDNIYYNGTKDKRAITTQRMSIYHRKPHDFNKINTFRFPPYIRCGDFQYLSKPCKLGLLAGNRFELVIRKISRNVSVESADMLLSSLARDGFINYFGLQRFGKGGCRSHEIGKFLLQSNWSQCIQSLFHLSSMDREDIREGKHLFHQKKYQEAYQALPSALISERLVLQSLIKYPEDYMNAFHKISKNIRLIYLHAYQSYLWNIVASKRVEKYGINIIEGDLVLMSSAIDTELLAEIPIEDLPEEPTDALEETQAEPEDGGKEIAAELSMPLKSETVPQATSLINANIHIITKEDVEQQRFKIADVVFPLIGSDILFPQNEFHQHYLDLLNKDQLSLEIFQKCHVIYRLKGGYRKLIETPKDLIWEWKEYSHDSEEINITELSNFLQNSGNVRGNKDVTNMVVDPEKEAFQAKREEKEEEAGIGLSLQRALLLKFSLSPGSYATMFLRELTKESTEFDYQTFLMAKKND